MGIDYNGRPDFSRARKLSEIENLQQYKDIIPDNTPDNERELATDELFSDVARTYLKGEVVKKALSEMEPAQFIPIEEDADTVRAAAIRIAKQESKDGTIVTYSMFQRCVDNILTKKWEIRGEVINARIPGTVYESTKETSRQTSRNGGVDITGMLKEFVEQNGIITTILGVLAISPFQATIFQALGVEKGAQGVQAAQVPTGLAIFLELGIRAERIIRILKESKLSTPGIENTLIDLEKSPEKRAEAFSNIGINYDDFKKSQLFQDSEIIVKYVNSYFSRYGGLLSEGSHLTLDHWVAYMQVAQSQQSLRGALNTSHIFSPKFQSYKRQFDPPLEQSNQQQQNIFNSAAKVDVGAAILNELASTVRLAQTTADETYDKIVNALNYPLSDYVLCCLVQIFGAIGNPDLLQALAVLLRILASGFGSALSRAFDLLLRALFALLRDALFELMAKLNEFYYKIVHKLVKIFTIEFEHSPACSIILSIAWALIEVVKQIFQIIYDILRELINAISGWAGFNLNFDWELTAERRHLLGIARILEVIAAKLSMANVCALNRDQKIVNTTEIFDDRQTRVDEAIFTILGSKDPVITISPENLNKHFPNLQPQTSKNIKISYGIRSQQNNETAQAKCEDRDQQDKLNDLIKNITSAIEESFNG